MSIQQVQRLFQGAYIARRNGIPYTYEATWHPTDDGFHWTATVMRGEQILGHISGDTADVQNVGERVLTQRWVETYIESGLGIQA